MCSQLPYQPTTSSRRRRSRSRDRSHPGADLFIAGYPLSSLLVPETPVNEPFVVPKTQGNTRRAERLRLQATGKTSAGGEFLVLSVRSFVDANLIKKEFPDAISFSDALCRGWVDLDSSLYRRELNDFLDQSPSINTDFSHFIKPINADIDSDGELLD